MKYRENMLDWFGLDPNSYSISIELLARLLGALYIVVYIPFILQMKGLFGKEGILPIKDYLAFVKQRLGRQRFYYLPSLFWLNASDTALLVLAWSGIALGTLLLLGFMPVVLLCLLYVIHLSLTSAGQEFLSFGWEMYLLEITLGLVLVIATTPYNAAAWIAFNVLLMRFYFQAGISKIFSRDPNWRNLTALGFHYLTQPLPNTLAWYFHKLPQRFHQLSTLYMYFVELIVPLLIFSPPEVRLFAFSQFFALQFFIWLTGNFSYLNHMSVIASVMLLHNVYLEPFLSLPAAGQETPLHWNGLMASLGALFLALQLISFWLTFYPHSVLRKFLDIFHPFHVAVPHGIFAVMTTKRHEVIVEGSADGQEWKEYEFYFKPGDLAWRPRRISPFQPRLDWQIWFLPFRPFGYESWFERFLVKLLQGEPAVTRLLKSNPFKEQPPLYVRALLYDYEYTTFEEKHETGHWWKRRFLGEYAPAMRINRD